jgi:hypothetical protein
LSIFFVTPQVARSAWFRQAAISISSIVPFEIPGFKGGVPANDVASQPGRSVSLDVSPDFIAAMDSYEAFFDSYIEFMESYDVSNMGMLAKYTDFMAQYVDTMAKMERIDEDELSDADAAYYALVMTRISTKLAGIGPQ